MIDPMKQRVQASLMLKRVTEQTEGTAQQGSLHNWQVHQEEAKQRRRLARGAAPVPWQLSTSVPHKMNEVLRCAFSGACSKPAAA